MDRSHWRSPSFRGRSPHPRHLNPRFRGGGDGGNFGAPRHFNPQWQQRSPSPYHYQQQRVSFSPHYQQSPHSFATSTPIHGSGGAGRRPWRGGGGGGRFNKRQSFGSPSVGKGGSGDDIDNWISPEMWADPWKAFLPSAEEGTTFAESDFSVSANESSRVTVTSVEGTNNTKFADTDFDVTESSSKLETTSEQASTDNPSSPPSVNASADVKTNTDDEVADDEDDFEKFATDRIVYESSDQSQS